MGNRVKDILILVLLAVVAVVLFKGYKGCKGDKAFEEADTLRVVVYDTIPYYKPVAKECRDADRVTRRLAVAESAENAGKGEKGNGMKGEKSEGLKGLKGQEGEKGEKGEKEGGRDSVEVEVPITQKVYEGDNYRAFVSGYNASLDSLLMFAPKEIMTITSRPKQKRWSVGIQVGYGMTLKGTPQFAPYVGVGVTWRVW